MFNNISRKDLEKVYLGKNVHVIIFNYIHDKDMWGVVTNIDEQGFIHGTWGEETINPEKDYISLTD